MTKVVCQPTRVGKKPGTKTVNVEAHKRSKPSDLPKKC